MLGAGDTMTISANPTQESRLEGFDVYILGGQPIREPVVARGPFVMNTMSEVMTAFEDYQSGKMGSIPAVHGEDSGSAE